MSFRPLVNVWGILGICWGLLWPFDLVSTCCNPKHYQQFSFTLMVTKISCWNTDPHWCFGHLKNVAAGEVQRSTALYWSSRSNANVVSAASLLPEKKPSITPVRHDSDSSRGNPGALMSGSIFCHVPWNFCTITLKLTFEPWCSSWCSACSWCGLWLFTASNYVSRHFGSLPLRWESVRFKKASRGRRGSSATTDFSWHLTPVMKLEDKLMCHSSIDFSFASRCPLVPEPAQPLLHVSGWITGALPPLNSPTSPPKHTHTPPLMKLSIVCRGVGGAVGSKGAFVGGPERCHTWLQVTTYSCHRPCHRGSDIKMKSCCSFN